MNSFKFKTVLKVAGTMLLSSSVNGANAYSLDLAALKAPAESTLSSAARLSAFLMEKGEKKASLLAVNRKIVNANSTMLGFKSPGISLQAEYIEPADPLLKKHAVLDLRTASPNNPSQWWRFSPDGNLLFVRENKLGNAKGRWEDVKQDDQKYQGLHRKGQDLLNECLLLPTCKAELDK